MTRYPKFILTILAVLTVSFSFSQKPVVYFFSEVGLTLYIPPDFKVVDAKQNDALNKKGEKMVEEANHLSMDVSQIKTLIAARKSNLDYFSVTIETYDVKKDGPYLKSVKLTNDILYHTFEEKLPKAKIDTITNMHKNIGGLDFTEFHISIPINEKMTINMFVLSKYYKGYSFGMTYMYVDDVTKNEMQGILQSCKFTN